MKTNRQTGFTLKHTLTTAGLIIGLAMASPAAAVQCGDTIGPNQTVTLQADLVCDDNTGGLTVIGPAEVDMNGHDIRCVDTDNDGYVPIGLVIRGQEAKVYGGGLVSDCYYGVSVSGEGRHTVENVTAQYSRVIAFSISSSKNILRQNYADQGLHGFLTGDQSNGNKLFDNRASFQDKNGFDIDGNKHQLHRNKAAYNGGDGFSLYGVGHKLMKNEAEYNDFDGFDLQEGATTQVTLRQNLADRNGQDGFQISGQQHKLEQNKAYRNEHDGIQVHDASRIVLRNNEALNNNQANSPTILFDLKDNTPNCGTNTWQKNTFGTASQPCIQ